jgi:7,8-dihydroneopterin aldolase/epimerase/oxygenase
VDEIVIKELVVSYRVGVPDDERVKPQRLSLTVVMETNIGPAAAADALERTIDYHAVAQRLLLFGDGRAWKLIETLAVELAEMILREFKPQRVSLEVKKFILPEARHVSVRVTRAAGPGTCRAGILPAG